MKLTIRKSTLQIITIFIGLVAIIISFFSLLSVLEQRMVTANRQVSQYSEYDREIFSYNGITYMPQEELETILLIGVDKFKTDTVAESYNNTQQADFLMLIIINHHNKTYSALHLNRDTMTEITMLGVRGEKAGSFVGQIALAHTYGKGGRDSCLNTIEAVSNLLYGVKIDHYASFTMDAVAQINDLSGGIQIELLEDFSIIDPTMKKGNIITLQGNQALVYVRARKDLEDSTNLSRMIRQRQYLNALGGQIQTCIERDEEFMLDAVTKISSYIESDFTVEQLSRLFQTIKNYRNGGVDTVVGEAVQAEEYIEYYVKEEMLRMFILSKFYEPYVEVE